MCTNWKQSIEYFFINSTLPAIKLKDIIIQSITKLQQIGYIVIAFISYGAKFHECSIKRQQNRHIFFVNNQQIAYFIDPPHAIKINHNNCMRNNIKYNLKFILSRKYIKELYNIDKKNKYRLALKI